MKTFKFIEEILKNNPGLTYSEYRVLNAIMAGNYKLSIQGSTGHYCSPRETIHPSRYYTMELAIFRLKGGFLKVSKSSILRKFERYDELCERADGPMSGTTVVFGYVPIDLIEDLYQYLNNL